MNCEACSICVLRFCLVWPFTYTAAAFFIFNFRRAVSKISSMTSAQRFGHTNHLLAHTVQNGRLQMRLKASVTCLRWVRKSYLMK